VSWNGNAFSGAGQFAAFLQKCPETRHEVELLSCHPMPYDGDVLAVTVHGRVSFAEPGNGAEMKRDFQQSFCVRMRGDAFQILDDVFRFK